MKKLGLLPRLILGIILGIVIGNLNLPNSQNFGNIQLYLW